MNRHTNDPTLRALREPAPNDGAAPLTGRDDHGAPSVFRPESLMREARRQKSLPAGSVPPVCVLDPDGDMVAHVRKAFDARPCPQWACYHTQMWTWETDGLACGIIGHVVGGSFAVLVAEQLFASGCGLLVSVASAGQITDIGPPPYYILVERALRDEGTSYHYAPPATYAAADPALLALAADALASHQVFLGDTWTTDAPFRETEATIASRRRDGILAVEMEAASLYAFAAARGRPVICLAHVSNQLGCVDGDFEKGDGNGAAGSLKLVTALAAAWRRKSVGSAAG
jgi:purine-nucleoside phosphorylase